MSCCENIWHASCHNCTSCTQRFIQNGVDINSKCPIAHWHDPGLTPLHIVSKRGHHVDCLQFLLDQGANVNVVVDTLSQGVFYKNTTPLFLAVNNGRIDCIRLLLAYGANPNIKTNEASLHIAVRRSSRDIEIVQLLLSHHANINEPNDIGATPLHLACELNRIEIVKFLLEQGADYTLQNCIGKTAKECCNNEVIKNLISSYECDVKEPEYL